MNDSTINDVTAWIDKTRLDSVANVRIKLMTYCKLKRRTDLSGGHWLLFSNIHEDFVLLKHPNKQFLLTNNHNSLPATHIRNKALMRATKILYLKRKTPCNSQSAT